VFYQLEPLVSSLRAGRLNRLFVEQLHALFRLFCQQRLPIIRKLSRPRTSGASRCHPSSSRWHPNN